MERAHQAVQSFPHPLDSIFEIPRRRLLRRKWKSRRSRESDSRPPFLVLPPFQFVAEFVPKLVQGTLYLPIHVGTGLDLVPAGQVTADNRVATVEEAHEQQSRNRRTQSAAP